MRLFESSRVTHFSIIGFLVRNGLRQLGDVRRDPSRLFYLGKLNQSEFDVPCVLHG
jgi:hypothetical protein